MILVLTMCLPSSPISAQAGIQEEELCLNNNNNKLIFLYLLYMHTKSLPNKKKKRDYYVRYISVAVWHWLR